MSRLPVQDDECAAMLRVLGDATRLKVVQQLFRGTRRVGELNEVIEVEQSLLSHHLRVLRDAGIVEAKRDGKGVLYRLAPAVEKRRRGQVLNLGCCRLTFDQHTSERDS